nr:AMP-binding protein [Amycolatopsis umgeniensis]
MRPDAPAVAHWSDGSVREQFTFGELGDLVRRAGSGLRTGTATGDRAILSLPNDVSFTAAFLACHEAGLVPVPAPAFGGSRRQAVELRLLGMVADCRPAVVITVERWAAPLRALVAEAGLRCPVRSWEELRGHRAVPGGARAAAGFAFLQYTSGSTGTPKGVAISHRASRAGCAQAAVAYRERPADTAVTWVPLHHDMGLLTGVLRPLFSGYLSVLMSPREFAAAPAAWLSAISVTRGTLSSAPDFAYDRCVRRVPAADVREFDLSAWRVARDAGEVVRAATAERFTTHFAEAGFVADAFCPSYGMAEATLTVTTCSPELRPLRLPVGRDALHQVRIRPPRSGEPVTTLLSSGAPLPGTQVTIRNPNPDGIGEIVISGPQLFDGYWPATPGGRTGGHATGDRGFLRDGQLFVLGRADEVLVCHGRNFHPADVIAACAEVPGLRPGRCAAFVTEPDRVVLVAEARQPWDDGAGAELARLVRLRLADRLELYVSDVALLAPGELPLTTSGKVRVAETRRAYADGSLSVRWPPASR